jgi:hypothetical protein
VGVLTFEGMVEDGQIRLVAGVRLPDKTKVYVVVPEAGIEPVGRILSPRLAHPEQSADFRLEVSEEEPDAGL